MVPRDVEGALLGREGGNDGEARRVDGAFGLLGVLEGDTDLVGQGGTLVGAEESGGLREVVLDEIEEGGVVGFRDAGVVDDEGAVCD